MYKLTHNGNIIFEGGIVECIEQKEKIIEQYIKTMLATQHTTYVLMRASILNNELEVIN
jgi:hypothetical protein